MRDGQGKRSREMRGLNGYVRGGMRGKMGGRRENNWQKREERENYSVSGAKLFLRSIDASDVELDLPHIIGLER